MLAEYGSEWANPLTSLGTRSTQLLGKHGTKHARDLIRGLPREFEAREKGCTEQAGLCGTQLPTLDLPYQRIHLVAALQ